MVIIRYTFSIIKTCPQLEPMREVILFFITRTQRIFYYSIVCRTVYNDNNNDNDNDKVFYSTLIIHFISQIFSQKRGVSLRLKFGETQNGGQSITGGNSKAAYSKKSPSQIKMDEKRSQERKVTRQQARIANKKEESEIEIENP